MKNRNIWNISWDSRKTPFSFLKKYWFDKYFDPCPFEHDLKKWDWLKINRQKNNFINPPYSQKLKEAFIKKAIEESKKWKNCVMLLPVSTDTKIFHNEILPNKKKIIFIKWRLKFSGWNSKWNWVENKCWMSGSMLVYF
jgi:hypothetical protein